MKAYLNNEEIPLIDCLNDQGHIICPEYMKEGDIFTLRSDYIEMNNPRRNDILPELSELIH